MMWIIKETGQVFANRKEAKNKLGHYYFNKLCKEKKIVYNLPDCIAYDESICKNTEEAEQTDW